VNCALWHELPKVSEKRLALPWPTNLIPVLEGASGQPKLHIRITRLGNIAQVFRLKAEDRKAIMIIHACLFLQSIYLSSYRILSSTRRLARFSETSFSNA
jgi:hypothetical protein